MSILVLLYFSLKSTFQPRLYKDKLEAIFAKKQKEAQAQNQILSSLSDCNTTSDFNTDVFNSSNTSDSSGTDSTLIQSSDDEITTKLENLEVESSTSTLPFCECNLKMKLSTTNFAICR